MSGGFLPLVRVVRWPWPLRPRLVAHAGGLAFKVHFVRLPSHSPDVSVLEINVKATLRWFTCLMVLAAFVGCGDTANRAATSLEGAVKELQKGAKTFDELKIILADLKTKLDNEVYKRQVEDLIHTSGQVAQLSFEGSADFVRQRVIEDLQALKAGITGQPMPARIPVLSNFQSPSIDFRNTARTTVLIVGWNLDVAAGDTTKYSVDVENTKAEKRPVPEVFVSYQGQYAVVVNVSSSGLPLTHHDARLVFNGYAAPSHVAIVKSDPPPPPKKITEIELSVGTTWDDKDSEITFQYSIQRKSDGHQLASIAVGGGEVWPDPSDQKPHWRSFTIPIPEGSRFPVADRFSYRLHVKYTSSDGDPKWNGRFRARALVEGTDLIPILTETADFDFGHRGDGNPDDRDFEFNH